METDALPRSAGALTGLMVRWGAVALVATTVFIFLAAHSVYRGVPGIGEIGGWRDWSDQGRYIEAARAWAIGDLTGARHWYPPGYALLAAPWLWVTPHDRFLIPNLASLIIAQFACAALARRLFPGNRFASLLGAGAFLVASVGTPPGLRSWLVPWTTTPATALTLLALLAVLRLTERPGMMRALLAGAAVGGITLFRPSDMVPVAIASALVLAPWLLRLPLRQAAGMAGSIILGSGAALAGAAGLVAVTNGFDSGYFGISARFGFEFRLLPLRWVTFVISGQPLFDGVGTERLEGGLRRGLAEVFPWIIPGIGGMAACWIGGRAGRPHALLAAWLAVHMALLLSYRDLHTLGFWLYSNYHYFKAAQPVLMLFALLLVSGLATRETRLPAAIAAGGAIILAFGWRAELVPHPAPAAAVVGGVAVPPLPDPTMAAVLRGRTTWNAAYFGENWLHIGGRAYHSLFDFRLYPRGEDVLLVPVRPLPDAPGVLIPAPGFAAEPGMAAERMRQDIRFGLPCAFRLAGRDICGGAGTPFIPVR